MDYADRAEDVQIAARALGAMRDAAANDDSGRPRSPATATSSSTTTARSDSFLSLPSSRTSLPAPADDGEDDGARPPSDLLPRLQSAHPLFDTALRAYTTTKASSRVVKFGAEMVESTIMRVGERLVGEGIDDFAVRQLDRLDRFRRPSQSAPDAAPMRRKKTLDGTGSEVESLAPGSAVDSPAPGDPMDVDDRVGGWLDSSILPDAAHTPSSSSASPPLSAAPSRPRSRSRTPTRAPHPHADTAPRDPPQLAPSHALLPPARASRWQALIMGTPGVAAAVRISDESRRRLRFVLGWLAYATQHIDGQILVLRDLIAALQPVGAVGADARDDDGEGGEEGGGDAGVGRGDDGQGASSAAEHTAAAHTAHTTPTSPTSPTSPSPTSPTSHTAHTSPATAAHTVHTIKHDLVATVRQVVGVVSRYGGK
ncbi:transcription factor Opi1, partial [Schizophyllum fasciatum]